MMQRAGLDYTRHGLLLFIQVDDLADVKERLAGADDVVEPFPEGDESGE